MPVVNSKKYVGAFVTERAHIGTASMASPDTVLSSVVGGLVAVVVLLALLRAVRGGKGPLRALCGCDDVEGYDNNPLNDNMKKEIMMKCYQGAAGTVHLSKIFNLATHDRTAVYNACQQGRDAYKKTNNLTGAQCQGGRAKCADSYLQRVYPCTNLDKSKCCNINGKSCVPKDFAAGWKKRMNVEEGAAKCRQACKDDAQYCNFVVQGEKERCCSRLNDKWCVTVGKVPAAPATAPAASLKAVDLPGYDATKVTFYNMKGVPTQAFNNGTRVNIRDSAYNGWFDGGISRIHVPAGKQVVLRGLLKSNERVLAPGNYMLAQFNLSRGDETWNTAVRSVQVQSAATPAKAPAAPFVYKPPANWDNTKVTFYNMNSVGTQAFNDGKLHDVTASAYTQWYGGRGGGRGVRRIKVPAGKEVVLVDAAGSAATFGQGDHPLLGYKATSNKLTDSTYACANSECWAMKVKYVKVQNATTIAPPAFPGAVRADRNKIVFFEHPNGYGLLRKFEPGKNGIQITTGSNARFIHRLTENANDTASSVYVPAGYHIWVYEQPDGSGGNIRLDGGTTGKLFNLGNYKWNDQGTGADQGKWACVDGAKCWDNIASSFAVLKN